MSHATTSSAETAALSAASAAQPAPTSATAATSVPKPTLHAADPTVRSLLLKGNFGLEKETLRIDHDGFMAQTPNPFPGHPHITRDFCENQVEINTGIHPTYQGVLAELNDHNTTIQRTLAEADEYLWPFSNPPYLRNERDVPVAQFTGELAHKTAYREYLSDRYGRYKMTFCGIHFNYSFADELLQADFALSDYQDFAAYKNDLYVKLAELAVAYGWVMVAATAASPLNDGSYVERTGLGQDLYLGLSGGYQSSHPSLQHPQYLRPEPDRHRPLRRRRLHGRLLLCVLPDLSAHRRRRISQAGQVSEQKPAAVQRRGRQHRLCHPRPEPRGLPVL